MFSGKHERAINWAVRAIHVYFILSTSIRCEIINSYCQIARVRYELDRKTLSNNSYRNRQNINIYIRI